MATASSILAYGSVAGSFATGETKGGGTRRYHLSISAAAIDADPVLLETVAGAGVTDVWLVAYLYGHWLTSPAEIEKRIKSIEAKGLAAHVINVPLGHPGDALGAQSGDVPLTPPEHWRYAIDAEGKRFSGTSLHRPATEENVAAMRTLNSIGVKRVFLDDDFRLARSPGTIGGCFCDEHKRVFLQKTGRGESQWGELLEAVGKRELTPVLRDWVDFTCDALGECFRVQQAASPETALGIMVMYFGAEKAGIRLTDYRDVMFRVGECHFGDDEFTPVKGKTDELFSCLFHRRFARPELAYSETTAFPADKLSAANMAAKLNISTIADVRNTMYMSGLTAFPRTHWETLAPAMKHNGEIHARLAGHKPCGPLKHYWGEASRYVGDDNPYSLFLALGVPFEVTDAPDKDGYTFLSDADAKAASRGQVKGNGTVFVARSQAGGANDAIRTVPENFGDLWKLKQEIIAKHAAVPYVAGETPVVCSWYPTAQAVLLWNLSERRENLTLCFGAQRREVAVEPLQISLVPLASKSR